MKSLQTIGAVIGLESLDEICGGYYKNGEKEERDSREAQLAYCGCSNKTLVSIGDYI